MKGSIFAPIYAGDFPAIKSIAAEIGVGMLDFQSECWGSNLGRVLGFYRAGTRRLCSEDLEVLAVEGRGSSTPFHRFILDVYT